MGKDSIIAVSIIVPVYNAEKYLHRCVDSILAQTFTDFELLLINDGSKDNSGKICDEYAAKDSRVRVFHKENGGVSSARNLGLDNAKGEWVTFVDSDDWVNSSYINNLYMRSHKGVDLVFSYATIDKGIESYKEVYPSCLVESTCLDGIFAANDLHWHTSPWSKLYRMSLITKAGLCFNENVCIGEDLIFLYSYILLCGKIYVSPDTDYVYNSNVQNSLTKKVFKIESELEGLAEITKVIGLIVKHGQIRSNASVANTRWIIGHYTRRVLTAIYYSNIKTRKRRIKILKGLDLECYFSTYKKSSGKESILRYLLMKRFYTIYDIVRRIVVLTKK